MTPPAPRPVLRFAPSPNGPLHLGHALSALLNADMAREIGGRMLVRIEDIDMARARPEHEASIMEDLAWLHVTYETPVRRQTGHLSRYRSALGRLREMGLLYPSFLTRAQLRDTHAARRAAGLDVPLDPDGAPLPPVEERSLSPSERDRRMAAGEPYSWRLDIARAVREAEALAGRQLQWTETGAGPGGETGVIAADPAAWGDVVVARKEVPGSYHLCVVCDDAEQGVTHVVRGRDLFHATSVHRLLQVLLGLPQPVYHHHRLVLDADGRKLSKSRGSAALGALRQAGATPADIRRLVGLPPVDQKDADA